MSRRSSADRAQRVAAVVRRVPGYLAARDAVLPRLRSSTALADVVWRVLGPDSDLGSTRSPLRGGRHLSGRDVDRLPVVGFDLLAVPPEGLPAAVDGIAALQVATAAFRPVLVLGTPAFDLARAHGYPVDLVASAADWWGDPADHPAYVARRLVSVRQGFRLWHLVRVGVDGSVPEADVALLRAVRPAMRRTLDPDVHVVPDPGTA